MQVFGLKGLVAAVSLALASACLANDNPRPPFIKGDILKTVYDGISDDLLTAGLGKSGLQSGVAPALSSPPTVAELRRLAIYTNYRALVDFTTRGGFGVLYGPNIDPAGNDTLGEGKIAGDEYVAYAGPASGDENVTMMVQVPASFDPHDPCIVTAPSSASRGVYGAIATAGEWGLKRGCAVAYTDKGTGNGVHDLQHNTVNLITGVRADADEAGKDSNFTARLNAEQLAVFDAVTPDRFAFKHAHSRQNPEKDWGRDVLRSIRFAFFVLNEKFGNAPAITPANTIVIASSLSNGGASSIRAAEIDDEGLIDGVAVTEPNVNPQPGAPFGIVQGAQPPFFDHSKPLYDYMTLLSVYQPCASRAAENLTAPFNLVPAALGDNRCTSLREKGLLHADTLAEQATEAQAIINAYGLLPEQNVVQPSHLTAFVPQANAFTYSNSYGRFGVEDNVCGFSLGATDANGNPIALSQAATERLFGVSNGIPPTGGVNLINNRSVGGPRNDRVSISPSTGRADQNLDGALCQRALAIGIDPVTKQPLTGRARAQHAMIAEGIAKIRASGNLHGVPTLIATGRADAVLPINHTSRAYYGLNQLVEGAASNVHYYEVTNAQHLETFNPIAGFDTRFIPLHHYFIQVMDLMFDHLKHGTLLPPSQVVHTTPRGGTPGAAPQITLANVPPISSSPAPGDLIVFTGNLLKIPD